MNDDPRFARVTLRKAEAVLAAAGLTPSRLAMTARHMTRARAALEMSCAEFEGKAVRMNAAGFAQLDVPALRAVPEEIGLRVLSRLIMRVGGLAYPPRFAGLESVYQAVRGAALGRGRTLGGCRVLPAREERLLILREPAALAPFQAIEAGRVQLWDGRFKVRVAKAPQDGKAAVGALGLGGVQFLRKTAPDTLPRVIAPARMSLPALWLGTALAAVPHLGYAGPGAPPFEAAFTGV
jgi:tRNA(Ile)-lysidine synthase